MGNLIFVQFMLLGICFSSILLSVTAEEPTCNTLQLGPEEGLTITIFDNNFEVDEDIWDKLCSVIKQFPTGLIGIDYRPGALSTGTVDNIQCGPVNCEKDRKLGCEVKKCPGFNDCYMETLANDVGVNACLSNTDINQFLLDNASDRAKWGVPEDAVPTLALNKSYDPCVTFGTVEEIRSYLCTVYQNQVGPCT